MGDNLIYIYTYLIDLKVTASVKNYISRILLKPQFYLYI